MHIKIAALRIESAISREIGCLGGVSDDGIGWKQTPQGICKCDQPEFSAAVSLLESWSVFPIDVYTIELVVSYKCSKLIRTFDWIIAG